MDTDFSNPMNNLPCEQDVLVLRSITCRLYFLAWYFFSALVFGGVPIFSFYTMVKDGWPRDILGWIFTVTLFPFAVLGLVLIWMFVRSILQLFNPPIKLNIATEAVDVGRQYRTELEHIRNNRGNKEYENISRSNIF